MTWQLTQEELDHFRKIRDSARRKKEPMVLWGWKRDKVDGDRRQPESRTVYFSADLKEDQKGIGIKRAFFFLETRAKDQEILTLLHQTRGVGNDLNLTTWPDDKYLGYSRLRIVVGSPTDYDKDSVKRRLRGKPRITISKPQLVPEHKDYNLSSYAPFIFCVGSGLSSESGLPLLGSVHNLFEVDNSQTRELVFGARDTLPIRIARDLNGEFKKFCEFTIKAVKAPASTSHQLISNMHKKGVIKQIFTDNMDDILSKVSIPYIQTRLSIFPDRFPAQFNPGAKSLFVVGVAVDRRSVIKQARRKGLKIIAINPVLGVAPHSRNMDYLRSGDIFFKETAASALPKIIKQSKF